MGCEGTHAPIFWLKVTCDCGLTPDTHQSLHLCGLNYTTLYHMLESSKTRGGYTVPLYLSLMEKDLCCVGTDRRGPQYPTSKKIKIKVQLKNDRSLTPWDEFWSLAWILSQAPHLEPAGGSSGRSSKQRAGYTQACAFYAF